MNEQTMIGLKKYYDKVVRFTDSEDYEEAAANIRHIIETVVAELMVIYLPNSTSTDMLSSIDELSALGYINTTLSSALHDLRRLGNKGSHAKYGRTDITKQELLDSFPKVQYVIDAYMRSGTSAAMNSASVSANSVNQPKINKAYSSRSRATTGSVNQIHEKSLIGGCMPIILFCIWLGLVIGHRHEKQYILFAVIGIVYAVSVAFIRNTLVVSTPQMKHVACCILISIIVGMMFWGIDKYIIGGNSLNFLLWGIGYELLFLISANIIALIKRKPLIGIIVILAYTAINFYVISFQNIKPGIDSIVTGILLGVRCYFAFIHIVEENKKRCN